MQPCNHLRETHTSHQIDRRHGLLLRDVRGRTVTCISGSVWLTLEGDRRDVILDPGASFVVDRNGLTLLAAQRPSAVQLSVRSQANSWWTHRLVYLLGLLKQFARRPCLAWPYYRETKG